MYCSYHRKITALLIKLQQVYMLSENQMVTIITPDGAEVKTRVKLWLIITRN